MKCFVLLVPICVLVALSGCDKLPDQNDRVKKKADKVSISIASKEKLDDADSELESDKGTNIGKRQLGERFFGMPKGNAYSYTHVVQTHGPVRKVVHAAPLPYREEDVDADDVDHGYEPTATAEPYYGPIYVTAKPVLAGKSSGRAVTTAEDDHSSQTHHDRLAVPFTYPLFTPYYDDVIDKQYTVPVQVVYRIPLQKGYTYQQLQHPYPYNYPYAIDDRLASYPADRTFAYTLHKPYASQTGTGLSYPLYPENNYIGAYTDPDASTQDDTSASNAYSSDENRR